MTDTRQRAYSQDEATELIRTLPDTVRAALLGTLAVEPLDEWTPQDAARLLQQGAVVADRVRAHDVTQTQVEVLLNELCDQAGRAERHASAIESMTGFTAWRAIFVDGDEEPTGIQHLYAGHGRRWTHLFVNETDSEGRLVEVSRWTPQRFVFGKWRANPLAPARETWAHIIRRTPLFDIHPVDL